MLDSDHIFGKKNVFPYFEQFFIQNKGNSYYLAGLHNASLHARTLNRQTIWEQLKGYNPV